MAKFKDRLPDLVQEYRRMESDFQQRINDIWEDCVGKFQMTNDLTERQMEKVEEASDDC